MKKLLPSPWNLLSLMDDDWIGSQGSDLSVWEDQHCVAAEVSLPGVNLDDIEINYHNGVLWIKAEKKEEESQGKRWYHRASQSYSYRVAIPGQIDDKKEPEASLKNGILQIKFKKAVLEKPKKIKIKES